MTGARSPTGCRQAVGPVGGVSLRRFVRSVRGTAGVEFAIALPVLLTMMVAGVQLTTYIEAVRKVDLVAQSVSQMISQVVPPDGATVASIYASDIHFTYDSTIVLFPYVLKDAQRRGVAWWQDVSINYAGIQFTQTASNCNDPTDLSACYVANVVWTSSGTSQPSSGANYRPCVTPQVPAANNATPSRLTLPRSIYGPASLIVIDVVFSFQPSFGSGFIPALRIARSVYVQPRYATLVKYNTTNDDGIAALCPGY